MGVEQGQIGKTEEMADLNKNQDPGVDSLSAARPYRPLSLRARLILLLFVIAIPLTGMALGFQKMIASYSASYDAILANLKTANEYNIKFKSDMEYSMYLSLIHISMLPLEPALVGIYPIFFASAFQWGVYSGADGFNSATIFMTNNFKQSVLGWLQYGLTKDKEFKRKAILYTYTVISFFLGVVLGAVSYTHLTS